MNHHIHKKLAAAVGDLKEAVVFFYYGSDGDQAQPCPAVLCGPISGLSLSDVPIKAVGSHHVQAVSAPLFYGQVEIAFLLRQGLASLNSIFDDVSEQAGQIQLRHCQRVGKLNSPRCFDSGGDCCFVIISKQSIHGNIRAKVDGCALAQHVFVLRQIGPYSFQIPAFSHTRQQPEGVAEIVTQASGLFHVFLQGPVLAALHFQKLVSPFHPRPL